MLIIAFIALILIYLYGIKKLKYLVKHSLAPIVKFELKYSVFLLIIYGLIVLVIVLLVGNFISNQIIKFYITNTSSIKFTSDLVYQSVKESLKMLPSILEKYPNLEGYTTKVSFYIDNNNLLLLYKEYKKVSLFTHLCIGITILILGIVTTNQLISKLSYKFNAQANFEALVKKFLFISSLVTILATVAIIISLLWQTIEFFNQVPLFNFLFGTHWTPQNHSVDPHNSFGIVPLLAGTFLIAIIACFIAIIIGLPAAIYMSEFIPKNIKNIAKPILEILSGIPTIVYGFFAALVCGPFLTKLLGYFNIHTTSESALVAGVIIGIMIIPFISSATDDIISSIPKSIREGAYALGSMSYEVVLKVLLPVAMPGILSSFLLAFSRAIGETMIVVMASGLVANLTLNPLHSVTTITTQIVTIAQGDQDFDCIKTLSLFALGLTLFCITLLLNLFSFWVIKKFQSKY